MRKVAIGLAIGAAAWALASGLARVGVFEELELSTYDRRLQATQSTGDARNDLVLIEIDETSLRLLEPTFGGWPWPRMIHAAVVDFLTRGKVKSIAYDVLFVDRDLRDPASDAEFVESVRRAGNVVLAAETMYEGLASDASAPATSTVATAPGAVARPQLRLPFDDLAAVAAGVGHTFLQLDPDGTARRVWPFVEVRDRRVPWLGLAANLATGGISDADLARVPLLPPPASQMLLRFRGPYADAAGQRTYPTYSFIDLLRSEDLILSGAPPLVDPAEFHDKHVFIGTTAAGLKDIYPSPFGGPAMPGMQLHAAAVDDVLSQRFMRKADGRVDLLVTAGASVAAGLAAVLLPVAWAVVLVVLGGAALVLALTATLGNGVWVALVPPVLGLALATFGGTAWQYFVEDRQKRLVQQLFGRYVSPDVFTHLMADPSLARLGGQRREMTVLFSDIRGFTSASERETPEAVVAQLNEYFTVMVRVLFRHHGTLDKFVGDMVMGLFGAPVTDPHHADHAVAAARDMLRELDVLNAAWKAEGRPTVEIGIGINSGEMIAGNIGSDTVMSYTVIGDAVNLGSRLESATKEYRARILISEATRALLTAPVPTREIGPIAVKGKAQMVTVHAVLEHAAVEKEMS
jgi:adenylate cyclase